MRAVPGLAGRRSGRDMILARLDSQARDDVETILRAEDGFCGGRLGDDDEAPSSIALRRARRERVIRAGCMAACAASFAFLAFVTLAHWRF